jgi:hypothetical protein
VSCFPLGKDKQRSTANGGGTPCSNQTNLAIKGIIGLKAMSQIAKLTNNDDQFGDVADKYLQQWTKLGINTQANPPHTTLSYGNNSSHGTKTPPTPLFISAVSCPLTCPCQGLLYNIYIDKLLNLDFIPQSVFDMQSAFYPTVANEYGVPLDTRHTWTKSDWEMFAAAVASDATRDLLVAALARWVGSATTDRPMSDLFDSVTGGFPQGGPTFVARPVAGGMFALLALTTGWNS